MWNPSSPFLRQAGQAQPADSAEHAPWPQPPARPGEPTSVVHLRPGDATAAGERIRLVFPTAADAEWKIAGVARAARAAAAFASARSVWIDIANGDTLAAGAMDDIGRANGHAVLCPRASEITAYRQVALPPDRSIADILKATGKPSDGIVSRWINRPVSRMISRLLLAVTGIRPVHATLLTATFGVAMLFCLLMGSHWGLVAGGVLFQAASVLDGVDGEIARATYRSSARGAMLDTAVDMVINVGFVVGLTACLTALYGPAQAALGASAVAMMVSGLLILAWLARKVGDPGNFNVVKIFYRTNFPTGLGARITDALVFATSRDFFALLFALMIVAGLGGSIPALLNGFAIVWLGLTLWSVRPILAGSAGRVPLVGRRRAT